MRLQGVCYEGRPYEIVGVKPRKEQAFMVKSKTKDELIELLFEFKTNEDNYLFSDLNGNMHTRFVSYTLIKEDNG